MTALPETTHTFFHEVLVQCPRCSRQAVLTGAGHRLICAECGYVRERDPQGQSINWWTVRQDGHEPAFGLPLWLAADCCGGHVLWALNEPYLDYLERFVSSTSRDRDLPSPSGNRGLAGQAA